MSRSDRLHPIPRTKSQLPATLSGRLRIAMVMPPWYDVPPRAYGGIESLVADLIDALVERGHDVVMIGSGNNGTKADFLRTYEVAPSERLGEAMPELIHGAWSERHLDDLDVDIVHDHSMAGPLTARGRSSPTVLTAHGPVTGEIGRYYRTLCPEVHLVAISNSQRRLAPDLNWAGMVYNTLRCSDFPFQRNKEDFVLFLGRFSPDKGAHLAIDAARRAGRPIILAGKLQEPGEWAYFEAEVRPRLGSDAEYIGQVDMAGKQELYSAAHCLVFPIRWEEPFGMVMIESMVCGTPVVALRRGSVPEVVVDGVTGIVRDDPADLPAAIEEAGNLDPEACRTHVERNFDVSIMAAGYEKIYERFAGRPAHQRRHGRSRVPSFTDARAGIGT